MAQLLAVLAAVLIIQPVLAGALGGAKTTASVSVMAGVVWMVALCAGDAAATIAGAYPRAVTLLLIPAFVGAGLLQLVTGVLHHMLPILVGAARPAHGQTAGMVRVGAINLGGVLSVLGIAGVSTAGLIMMGLGLIANIAALAWAVTSSQGEGHVKRAR